MEGGKEARVRYQAASEEAKVRLCEVESELERTFPCPSLPFSLASGSCSYAGATKDSEERPFWQQRPW